MFIMLQYITTHLCKTQQVPLMPKIREFSGLAQDYSEYEPNFSLISDSNSILRGKRLKLKQKKKKISSLFKNGGWQIEEERKFMDFMLGNKEIFVSKPMRRKCHIFKLMADFVKTRTSEQCRSHHQKYEIKFGQFSNIIEHLTEKIEKNIFSLNKLGFIGQTQLHEKQKAELECLLLGENMQENQMAENERERMSFEDKIESKQKTKESGCFERIQFGQGYEIFSFRGNQIEIQVLLDLDVFLKH